MFSEEEAILNSQIKELHAVLTLEDFWDPLFDMLFEFMENPILFMDGSHKITISRYSKPIHNKVWKEDLELGYHDYSTIDDSFHDVMKQLFSTRQPVFTTNDGEKCVLCTAISANSVVGFIAVLEHYRPLSKNDLKLLRVAADIISAKSERYVIYQSDSNHFYGQIIQDMIEKRIKTETELANRLKTRNWKLLSCFRVIVINTEDKSHRYQRFMKNQLNIIAIGFKQLYYNDRFVLLQESEQTISKELPKDFADFILHQNLKCSVSDVFPNIFQLSIHYDQAVHMLLLDELYDMKKQICYYDDFRFLDFLQSCCSSMDIESMFHPVLSILSEHDSQHGTELGKTLDNYLINNKSIQKTASDMFLHKNTINYRINQSQLTPTCRSRGLEKKFFEALVD